MKSMNLIKSTYPQSIVCLLFASVIFCTEHMAVKGAGIGKFKISTFCTSISLAFIEMTLTKTSGDVVLC